MIRRKSHGFLGVCFFASIVAAGCGSTGTPAPVFERTSEETQTTRVEERNVGAGGTSSSKTSQPSSVGTSSSTASSPGQSAQIESRSDGAQSKAKPPPQSKTQSAAKTSTQTAKTTTKKNVARPVSQQPYREGDWRPEYHTVRKGDTAYGIALDYGRDYRDLARWNELPDAAYIQIGQQLRLFPVEGSGETIVQALPPSSSPVVGKPLPAAKQIPTFSDPKAFRAIYTDQAYADLQRQIAGQTQTAVIPAKPATSTGQEPSRPWTPSTKAREPAKAESVGLSNGRLSWEWPAPGKVIYKFASGPNKKGVVIGGKPGQAVVSGAPGKVVYSGTGLRGYGRLIIIKHNETYLSVYAHNSQLLVKEGQMVAQGQKIAVMGGAKPGSTTLHFEIRRLGKPIDPLSQLPARPS